MKIAEIEHRLELRGIKPTAMRNLIFGAMVTHPQAFSLADMETKLDTVDRSTLFRTIMLFHDHQLIHSIDDGSGSMKYSVCSSDCSCTPEDLHVHFSCNKCEHTYCLENISIPKVSLPERYLLESVNFVLKGLCDKCNVE